MNLTENQASAQDHLDNWRVGALFMDAGTGKTRVAVDLVNRIKDIDYILYVAPYRTIHTPDDIPSVVDEVNKWGGFNANVRYMGIESLQASDRLYLDVRAEIQQAIAPFIVVDESLKIKNADAKRTKRLLELGSIVQYKLILNGTPITRNVLDLWPQMEFLSPKILNMSLAEFKNTFCKYTTITKSFGGKRSYTKEFITGYENIDYLYSLIRHYIFECDLQLSVSQLYNNIAYVIDGEEKREYYELKEKYLNDEMLQWKNNNIFLEMTQKMQHTYCCAADKFLKLDELFKSIDESRTIIFCKYIRSQDSCRKKYPKATVLSYQKESLGLNLQHLCHTVYFDKNWDYGPRIHSTRRTWRTGQEYDCYYWDMTGDVGLEHMIDKNIDSKTRMVEYFKHKSKEQLLAEL